MDLPKAILIDSDSYAAQQVGIYAVWVDAHGNGLPDGITVRPDRIVGSISEVLG